MSDAEKYCITAAFVFFMAGLLSGVWKYYLMARDDNSRSRFYVDVAHRSSLMYAFSAFLLAFFARFSIFPSWVNSMSALATMTFFGLSIISYLVHGYLNDTNNQIHQAKQPQHKHFLSWAMPLSMVILIIVEVGGSAVLGMGALLGIWL